MLLCVGNDAGTTEPQTYGHTLSIHDALPITSPPKNGGCGGDERAGARSPARIQLSTPTATAPVVTPIALAMPGRSAVAIVAVRISATVDRHGCHVNFDSVIRLATSRRG